MSEKRGTTIRLSLETRDLLNNASRVLDRSKSDITEEALRDWLTKHRLNETFQVTVTKTSIVLSETGNDLKILEVTERNGIAPQEIAQNYKEQLRAPVRLVVQENVTWPKKQS